VSHELRGGGGAPFFFERKKKGGLMYQPSHQKKGEGKRKEKGTYHDAYVCIGEKG